MKQPRSEVILVLAMALAIGLSLQRAMATSLVVIADNCAAGLAVHAGHVRFDWPLTSAVAGLALTGMAAGVGLVCRVPAHGLRTAFGVSVLLMALFVLLQNREVFIPGLPLMEGPSQ